MEAALRFGVVAMGPHSSVRGRSFLNTIRETHLISFKRLADQADAGTRGLWSRQCLDAPWLGLWESPRREKL